MKDQGFAPMPPVPVPSGTPPERREGGDSSGGSISGEPRDRDAMDQEKRLRREIANSNERRRMQSINAGFQSLRNLLPHHEGEKLSKVRINTIFSSLFTLNLVMSTLIEFIPVHHQNTFRGKDSSCSIIIFILP